MWILSRIFLGFLSFSAGIATAGGFIAFISLIGIVTRLAAIGKSASKIRRYENCLAMGLVLMNLTSLYPIRFNWLPRLVAEICINVEGLFGGIFIGCLAGALAEVVNIFPILSRRLRIRKGFPYVIKAIAIGKCVGSLMQYYIFHE